MPEIAPEHMAVIERALQIAVEHYKTEIYKARKEATQTGRIAHGKTQVAAFKQAMMAYQEVLESYEW